MRFLLVCSGLFFFVQSYAQSAVSEISRLARNKFDWFITHQYDSIRALMDDNLQYIHSNAWIESYNDVIDNLKSGKLVYKKVYVEELNVRLYNQTAIVTGKGWFEGVNNGTSFALRLLFTEVYVKQGGRWKLANRHACRVP